MAKRETMRKKTKTEQQARVAAHTASTAGARVSVGSMDADEDMAMLKSET